MMQLETLIDSLGILLLFCLVFGMSATVNISKMRKQLTNRKAILTGILLQFVLLPLLGFLTVKMLQLDNTTGIMLLVVTSSPGGSYSNWWCSLFNSDLALSVTITAISTLLSMIFLPLNLVIYSKLTFDSDVVESLDWRSLFVSLLIVCAAIMIGLTCSAYFKSFEFNIIANKVGNFSGLMLVLFSLALSNSSSESRLWHRPWYFYVGVAIPCLLALLISNIVTSLFSIDKPERVTISIEACYQNTGIAASIALTMFEGKYSAEAMTIPVYYGMVEALIISLYCIMAWKLSWTKAPPDDSFWQVITTSYEVLLEKKELQEIELCLSDEETGEVVSSDHSSMNYYLCF